MAQPKQVTPILLTPTHSWLVSYTYFFHKPLLAQ